MRTTKMLTILVLALSLSVQVANADFIFGTATNLGPTVNSSGYEGNPSISADGLTLYLDSTRGGKGLELWVMTRPTISEPWGTPVNLGPAVNISGVRNPSISADGLSLYFDSNRAGHGSGDIFVTTRTSINDPWSEAVNLGPTVNSLASENNPSISADGLSLYFSDYPNPRPGGLGDSDIWVTRRATTNDLWGTPVNLGPNVNTSFYEGAPSISADGRTLFFESTEDPSAVRVDLIGNWDLWVTRRATIDDDWSTPVKLPSHVNIGKTFTPSISHDGSTLYFSSNRGAGYGFYDLWQVSIEPVVDLNGDGTVDAADMCIMVDHWGENYPLCDIGPPPLGDDIVDVQDLTVLAEHLFTCPGAVAHWPLDETEGDIAYDSVATNDAVVTGGAVWQPDGGQVRGALAFDGTDDFLSTDFVLNPMDGPFSVFAWIKGGAPGQVILSQVGTPMERGVKPGNTWLGTDPSEGKLMASLTHAALPLKSDVVITDDQWHDIGLVYDGSSKYLYVDGAEVAKDNARPLLGNDGGLHIGAGKDLEPGSFFSGLIDNVRIYDQAVKP